MAESQRDNNKIPTILATLNTSALTPTLVQVNPTNHRILVEDAVTGSDFGGNPAKRDNSGISVMMAVSSVDGVTPVPLYINSSGQLLIQST